MDKSLQKIITIANSWNREQQERDSQWMKHLEIYRSQKQHMKHLKKQMIHMKSLNDARGQYKRYKSYYDMCNTRTATIYNAMGEPCNLKVPSIFPGPKQSTKKRNKINQPRLSLVVRQSFLSRHDLSSQKLFKDFDDLSSEDDEKCLIYNPQLNETITTIYHLFAERSRIMSNGKIHKRGLLKDLTLRNIMTKYFNFLDLILLIVLN